jgi:RHS repeat-associated protein
MYTSKELQTGEFDQEVSSGLEMYDFHARFGACPERSRRDPQLGRWFTPDPAEEFSNPYLAMGNNPVMYVDPDGEFTLGIIRGFFDAVFSGGLEFWNADKEYVGNAWREAAPTLKGTAGNNAVRNWWGLFQGDGKQVLSRFTWELPQTILGYNSAQLANTLGNVESVDYYDGATVVTGKNTYLAWNLAGQAVALGSYIIGGRDLEASPENGLFRHEYGHYIQSQDVGLAYLPKFGIPSFFSSGDHDLHPVEQDANIRAFEYFEDFRDEWSFAAFPIVGYDRLLPFNSEVNQIALKSGKIRTTGWDYFPGWLFSPSQILYYTRTFNNQQ